MITQFPAFVNTIVLIITKVLFFIANVVLSIVTGGSHGTFVVSTGEFTLLGHGAG